MASELRSPETAEEWQAFHDIRRLELFENRGRIGVYDPDHPDDRDPRNRPLLLVVDGRPVGVARLDVRDDRTGVLRLVAVLGSEQGRGHGRAMQALLDDECRKAGIGMLYVNAAPTALGFYEKGGWERFTWDRSELCGIASECIQMRRPVPEATSVVQPQSGGPAVDYLRSGSVDLT